MISQSSFVSKLPIGMYLLSIYYSSKIPPEWALFISWNTTEHEKLIKQQIRKAVNNHVVALIKQRTTTS